MTWDGLRLTFWKSSETCWMTDCSSWHWLWRFFIFRSASCLSSSSSSLDVRHENSALLKHPTRCTWSSSGDISPAVEHHITSSVEGQIRFPLPLGLARDVLYPRLLAWIIQLFFLSCYQGIWIWTKKLASKSNFSYFPQSTSQLW